MISKRDVFLQKWNTVFIVQWSVFFNFKPKKKFKIWFYFTAFIQWWLVHVIIQTLCTIVNAFSVKSIFDIVYPL